MARSHRLAGSSYFRLAVKPAIRQAELVVGQQGLEVGADYEDLCSLDGPAFAWEYLKRNPEFIRARDRLKCEIDSGDLSPEQAEAFRRRWGLQFQDARPDKSKRVIWAAGALPSVIALTASSPGLSESKLELPGLVLPSDALRGARDLILDHVDGPMRVHVHEHSAGSVAVLLPLDQLFDIRTAAALRLWRYLSGRQPGPDPAALSLARRERIIGGLRALDGRLVQASYRAIADALFGTSGLSDRAWKTHDLRDRTIRLVRYGTTMMRSGYRQLLLHPYRRRS